MCGVLVKAALGVRKVVAKWYAGVATCYALELAGRLGYDAVSLGGDTLIRRRLVQIEKWRGNRIK